MRYWLVKPFDREGEVVEFVPTLTTMMHLLIAIVDEIWLSLDEHAFEMVHWHAEGLSEDCFSFSSFRPCWMSKYSVVGFGGWSVFWTSSIAIERHCIVVIKLVVRDSASSSEDEDLHFTDFRSSVRLWKCFNRSLLSYCLFMSSFLRFLLLLFLGAAAAAEENNGPWGFLREKYGALSQNGKLATGACVGFVSSRLVLKSATTAVKVAGVAFIT